MRIGDNWLKGILITADALNTINGGSVAPHVKIERMEGQYVMNINAPGVDQDQFQVEVRNNMLSINAQIHALGSDVYPDGFPMNIGKYEIPFDVDRKNVTARKSDGHLEVILPHNEMAGGFYKNVDIEDA